MGGSKGKEMSGDSDDGLGVGAASPAEAARIRAKALARMPVSFWRFWAIHLVAVVPLPWIGVSKTAVWTCALLFGIRMFAVTAGYHRYFSHRSFKTSRAFQLVLAILAQSTGQKSVIWWARNHRHHHRHSDDEQDRHSPIQLGFWRSHVGWVFDPVTDIPDGFTRDLERFPELRFLDRHQHLPITLLAVLVLALVGWADLVIGFFLSTVLVWHATFTINSLCHVIGKPRYDTGDTSKNNLWLALLTLGEGWHNNHHHYQNSVRQGFFWWEIDITYLVLVVLSWFGLVWDLRRPPASVLEQKLLSTAPPHRAVR